MALPMTLIIIAGEIDLSVESMAGLSCAILGFLFAAGVPVQCGDPDRAGHRRARAACSTACWSPALDLPSLVVTLGHPGPVPGPRPGRPRTAGHQRLPRVVHRLRLRDRPRARPSRGRCSSSSAWRSCWASSSTGPGSGARSTPSARTPGLALLGRPGRPVKLLLFVLSGTVAALAGVILTARFASARADVGQGLTLTVVTIVAARRGQHLRRPRHDPGRRPGRPDPGDPREHPAPDQCLGRDPEHRRRPAPDRLGRHPQPCSSGQVSDRSRSRRSTYVDRLRSALVRRSSP